MAYQNVAPGRMKGIENYKNVRKSSPPVIRLASPAQFAVQGRIIAAAGQLGGLELHSGAANVDAVGPSQRQLDLAVDDQRRPFRRIGGRERIGALGAVHQRTVCERVRTDRR